MVFRNTKTILLIFFIFSLSACFLQKSRNNIRSEKVFTVYMKDSLPFTVSLLYDKENIPEKYFAHVFTPVCEERVCYSLVIDIYWDLLGNFLKYKHPIDSPLTKFDHEVFTNEDKIKIHEILSDKSSLLKYYSTEELIDRKEKKVSAVIDGVTGATNTSLKSVVVSGAAHSSFTLWHIINGPAAEKILKYTETHFIDSLIIKMLKSDNYHYQYYALDKLPIDNNAEYFPYIIRLISKGGSYVPYFAVEKLPEFAWKSPENQLEILKLLNGVDFKTQNQIINKLIGIQLSVNALNRLIENLKLLSENQIIRSLDIVSFNQGSLNYDLLIKLTSLLRNPNKEISEKTFQILNDKSREFVEIKKVIEWYK